MINEAENFVFVVLLFHSTYKFPFILLPFVSFTVLYLLIRHQQNRFKHVKRTLSRKIKGWRMELFQSLLYKQR